MDVFNLMATLSLDSSKFDSGLSGAEGKAKSFGSVISGGIGTAVKVGAAAFAAAGAAATAFGVASVKTGMDFDSSMSQVAATMGTTVDQIENLRDFALDMGSKTSFSAVQAADALNYMALAGYDAEKSMGMLPNVLNLAAAGGMELASASDMVTDASSALGLTTEETTAMVDQMAQTASKSNTSVAQLGDAILTIGGTAQFMSGGTERLNTVLGILADNGIKGSEAGTHLRNMLLKLASPTDAGAAAIEELGLQIFDSSGNMRDMQDIMQDLGTAMADMTDEQKVQTISELFNARDVAAVNALLGTSTERWEELGGAIVDSTGAAEQMANTQLDNLAGDITLAKSAFEGLQITVSDMLTPAIREVVQAGTEGITQLTEALQSGDMEQVMGLLGEWLQTALDGIVEALPNVIDTGLQIFNSLLEGLVANLPMILTTGIDIIIQLVQGIISAIPTLISAVPVIINTIVSTLSARLPELLQKGYEFVSNIASGIGANLPAVISAAGNVISSLIQKFYTIMPQIYQKGFELISKLASGILNNLPAIASSIGQVIAKVITTIAQNLPQILQQGIQMMAKLAAGIIQAIPKVIAAIPQVIQGIVKGFSGHDWGSIGGNIISGIASGISSGVGSIINAAKSAASSALAAAKSFLGIKSPSRVMRDQVGKMIDAGIAEGITANMGTVENALSDVGDLAVPINTTYAEASSPFNTQRELVESIQEMDKGLVDKMIEALTYMRFDIDGREFARLVRDVRTA